MELAPVVAKDWNMTWQAGDYNLYGFVAENSLVRNSKDANEGSVKVKDEN